MHRDHKHIENTEKRYVIKREREIERETECICKCCTVYSLVETRCEQKQLLIFPEQFTGQGS